MYCQNCGTPVEGYVPAAPAEPMEVTLARINAERDVAVARLEASARRAELATAEDIAETQADAQVDSAVAVAEIITAESGEPEPEPAPEPGPLVIEAPAPEPEPDNAPPPVEHHQPAKSGGWWDSYS